MINSSRTNIGTRSRCRAVRKHIAKALVGQTVDLLVDAHTIVHGVVTGVLNEAGASKLVVDGTGYDLNQILTAMPASLAAEKQKAETGKTEIHPEFQLSTFPISAFPKQLQPQH